jgi:hypothetical protein
MRKSSLTKGILCATAFALTLPTLSSADEKAAKPGGKVEDKKAAKPGEVALEKPTLLCLGVRWVIHGDTNRNAAVAFYYRKDRRGGLFSGKPQWTRAMDLFPVNPTGMKTPPTKGATLFAGSVFDLTPDTPYELRLVLKDPDGGGKEEILKARTRGEPRPPDKMNVLHVFAAVADEEKIAEFAAKGVPMVRGLRAANEKAEPGTKLIIHEGWYWGGFKAKSGTPKEPIVWQGVNRDRCVIDGDGRGISISIDERHDIFFENLTFRNAGYAILGNGASRVVVRRCRFTQCSGCVYFKHHRKPGSLEDMYICDNEFIGHRNGWPRHKKIGPASGNAIMYNGEGHVIAFNRFRFFWDAIGTGDDPPTRAVDIYNNEFSELWDNGIEADYDDGNIRIFRNRFTNVLDPLSVQPLYGGPAYFVRNVLYNYLGSPLKMKRATGKGHPNGALYLHNTAIKLGTAVLCQNDYNIYNMFYRNNLFVGRPRGSVIEYGGRTLCIGFNYDYNIYVGKGSSFARWDKRGFKTIDDLRKQRGQEIHGIHLPSDEGIFATARMPDDSAVAYPTSRADVTLADKSPVLDKGQVLWNVNTDFTGKAPDPGAYERGRPIPHYGPRPEGAAHVSKPAKDGGRASREPQPPPPSPENVDLYASRLGDIRLERPTLTSLGMEVVVLGDMNGDGVVQIHAMKKGERWPKWVRGPDLRPFVPMGTDRRLQDSTRLFIGSIFNLDPGAEYSLKVTVDDLDGGDARILKARTLPLPDSLKHDKVIHVVTAEKSIKPVADKSRKKKRKKTAPEEIVTSLKDANKRAKPGTLIRIHPGTHQAGLALKSGTAEKPIVWQGEDRKTCILQAPGGQSVLDLTRARHVVIKDLAFSKADPAIQADGASGIVVQGCRFDACSKGIDMGRHLKDSPVQDNAIVDNEFIGLCESFPRTGSSKGQGSFGVRYTGSGIAINHNRFLRLWDAIATTSQRPKRSVDIIGNDFFQILDNAIEAYHAEHNLRVLRNRFFNTGDTIVIQELYGGPLYVIHNVIVNPGGEVMRMKPDAPKATNGLWFMHNTLVKQGTPLVCWGRYPLYNLYFRNNLVVGTPRSYFLEFGSGAYPRRSSFDYDGWVGDSKLFWRLGGPHHNTIKHLYRNTQHEEHGIHIRKLENVFVKGAVPDYKKAVAHKDIDLRLADISPFIDRGQALPGINDGFKGRAPDMGAYEHGAEPPKYGPRWE